MSNRVLARMKPEEITAIIDERSHHLQELERLAQDREERLAFADRVEKEFGYTQLKQAVAAEKPDTPADVVLLKTLVGLGIRPLNHDSVVRYKERMARSLLNMLMKAIGLPLLWGSGCTFLVIGIAAMLGTPVSAIKVLSNWPTCGYVFGVGFFFVWAEHVFIPRKEWRVSEIKSLWWVGAASSNLLPRGCLEMALRITTELKGATFNIHQLVNKTGSAFSWLPDPETIASFFDPDPFLEVRFGGEAYYVAVWDEPGFDGKLMEVD